MQTILGLDLGCETGWCLRYPDGTRDAGCLKLSDKKRVESQGMRIIRFEKLLDELQVCNRGIWPLVVYELVRQQHASSQAAHWYGAYLGHLFYLAEKWGFEYTSVEVGAVKKFATGKGNASKEMMLQAAQEKIGIVTTDHNTADACWIAELAWQNLIASSGTKGETE